MNILQKKEIKNSQNPFPTLKYINKKVSLPLISEILPIIFTQLVIFFRLFSFDAFGAGDFFATTKSNLTSFGFFPIWGGNINFGNSNLPSLTVNIYEYTGYLISHVIDAPAIIQRLIFFWPLVLIAPSSIYFFSRYFFNGNKLAIFAATTFFSINSYFIADVNWGTTLLIYPYAVAPFVFLCLLKSLRQRQFRWALLGSVVSCFGLAFDLRAGLFLVLTLIAFVLWHFFFYEGDNPFWKRSWFYLRFGFLFVAVPLLIFPFFILPLWAAKGSALPSFNSRLSELATFSSAKLSNALFLYDPTWPDAYIGKLTPAPTPLFVLLPILALLGLLFARKQPFIGFFALITLVGIFLTKGANPPLANINFWIFKHVPGFEAFREPHKFYFFVALGMTILIAAGMQGLYEWLQEFAWLKSRIILQRFATTLFLAGSLAIFVVMMRPAFFQEVHGNFASFQLPQWQQQLDAAQAADNNFYRTLWIPGKENISPFSDAHPIMSGEELDQSSYGMRPFVQLGDAAPAVHWSSLHNPTTPDLLRLAGVKYIYVPNTDYHKGFLDPFANFMGKSPAQLQAAKKFLDSQPWLKPTTATTNLIPAYSIANPQDHFFATNGRIYVSGPDDFFSTFDILPGVNFASQTLVTLDDRATQTILPGSTLVLNQQTLNDFIMSRLPDAQLIAPAAIAKLPGIPTVSSIWNAGNLDDKYSLSAINTKVQDYDFDYGKGFIYATQSGQTSFKLNVSAQEANGTDLWVRTLDNPLGSSIVITIENQTFKLDTMPSGNSNFHWHDLGTLNLPAGTHNVLITSNFGLNVINTMALLNGSDFSVAKTQADDLMKQEQVVEIAKFSQNQFDRQNVSQLSNASSIVVPTTGTYRPSVHLIAGADVTELRLSIDGKVVDYNLTAPEASGKVNQGVWYDLPALQLKQGQHNIKVTVMGLTQDVFPLDYLVLNVGEKTFSQVLQGQTAPATLTYNYVSPTKYIVHIQNATRPFDLVFDEAYDSNWRATYPGVKGQSPDQAYEMVQAYHISTPGSYDVTIEYRPQKFVDVGLILSAIGLLIVIGALIVFWRKRW